MIAKITTLCSFDTRQYANFTKGIFEFMQPAAKLFRLVNINHHISLLKSL